MDVAEGEDNAGTSHLEAYSSSSEVVSGLCQMLHLHSTLVKELLVALHASQHPSCVLSNLCLRIYAPNKSCRVALIYL